MKAGEEAEPVDDGGDPACWLHEFEDELLGDTEQVGDTEQDGDDEDRTD